MYLQYLLNRTRQQMWKKYTLILVFVASLRFVYGHGKQAIDFLYEILYIFWF